MNPGDIVAISPSSEMVWRITRLLPENRLEVEYVPNPIIIKQLSTYEVRLT